MIPEQSDEEVARKIYEIFGGKYAEGLPFSGMRGSIQKQWVECAKYLRAQRVEAFNEGMTRAAEIAREINDGRDWPVTRAIEHERDSRREV